MLCEPALAGTAGKPTRDALVIANDGKSDAAVIRAPNAGPYARRAADDIVKYIELMTGATPAIVDTAQAIEEALASSRPLLIVGEAALAAKPELWTTLAPVLKKNPYLRTDGIVLRREANRVYLAGNNDKAHYFAAAELLRAWGVRWFMPGEFGECVPEEKVLTVAELNSVASSPFEIRTYGISWLGEQAGADEFKLRNMMAGAEDFPNGGHALGKYTKGLAKTPFEVPLTAPETAPHVAAQVEKLYKENKYFSLGMEDGLYGSNYPRDKELMSLQWDKYMLRWSVTDSMLELYNGTLHILHERYPESASKIGFLAYSNMFLPPVRDLTMEPSLYAMLAPIDIDPIHAMDDPQSPPKQEYRTILERWAKLMDGRVTIYDYDQGMLVWRDLPNPSHQAFRHDVKRYRDVGILGFYTETRNALATTFINLYLRGRLMWNPDEDVDSLIADFHERFFGPAAKPMKAYWSAIFDAWAKTIVTEHEFFLAPAIYTPDLIRRLGVALHEAEGVVNAMTHDGRQLSRNESLYARRVHFVRLGYDVLSSYLTMVKAAAAEADYSAAVAAGERGLQARDALTAMDKTFTTTRLEKGHAFWPGEVQQYRDLLPFTNGEKGMLLAKLPLEWSFRRDPDRKGAERGFIDGSVDLTFWSKHGKEFNLDTRKDYPLDQWERIRTDLYPQAQGVRHPDRQSFVGDIWYRTDIELSAKQAGAAPHLRFPGLFNECELFVNGIETAVRMQNNLWWLNDYRFEWDVALKDKLRAGKNVIALRCHSEHHAGGVFRRPFLYAPVEQPPSKH
jgi:hypothetical protein